MTLATSVLIHRPVAVQTVRDFCNRELLNCPDAKTWDADWFTRYKPEYGRVANRPGQGLSAILEITYLPDGPITADFYATEDEPAEGRGADVGSMIVGFDTAYGYGRGHDYGCSDLHAYFIVRLAQEFGPITWENEYTGEWHRYSGPDDAALLDFGDPERGRRAVQDDATQRAA